MGRRKLLTDMSTRHLRRLRAQSCKTPERITKKKNLLTTLPNKNLRLVHEKKKSIVNEVKPKNAIDITLLEQNISEKSLDTLNEVLDEFVDEQLCIKETSSSCKEDVEFQDFVRKLIHWVITCKVKQTSVDKLLVILKQQIPFCKSLPNCAKTLLKTPRRCKINDLAPGHYCHFGIKVGLEEYFLLSNNDDHLNSNIKLQVHVDGIPVSDNNQLWPILARIVPNGHIFIIGCYLGTSKPDSSNEFLSQFVAEANIYTRNGFSFQGKIYNFSIESIICDAPARSFVLMTKDHAGYGSCSKCTIKGTREQNRVCFPPTDDYVQRNDDDFNLEIRQGDIYRHGRTILCDIDNLGLVSQVPLDYMHLVCIGVVRKFIFLSYKGSIEYRIFADGKANIFSEYLSYIMYDIPSEFARKPRDISKYTHMKATELRLLLLYIGPVALLSIIRKEQKVYKHFLTLHVAMRILCSQLAYDEKLVRYAGDLLNHYVECFVQLYGECYVSHNIHNLTHLAEDVLKFGPLDSFSAFCFENYLGVLKRLLRKGDQVLSQIHHRYSEMRANNILLFESKKDNSITARHEHNSGPLTGPTGNPQFSFITLGGDKFDTNEPNNCCLIDNAIVFIENFATSLCNGELVVIGKKFINVYNLYDYPCNSSILDIYEVQNLSNAYYVWPVKSIRKKCMKLPIPKKDNSFAIIPIMHSEGLRYATEFH